MERRSQMLLRESSDDHHVFVDGESESESGSLVI
jgi:hypothetical protein